MMPSGSQRAVTTLQTIRFWLAIALLVDAAVGLWWADRWQKLAPRLNVQRLALIEAAAAIVILLVHYLVDPPGR
jgi:hypothetical protein